MHDCVRLLIFINLLHLNPRLQRKLHCEYLIAVDCELDIRRGTAIQRLSLSGIIVFLLISKLLAHLIVLLKVIRMKVCVVSVFVTVIINKITRLELSFVKYAITNNDHTLH